MKSRRIGVCVLLLGGCLLALVGAIAFLHGRDRIELEQQEYRADLDQKDEKTALEEYRADLERIASLIESFTPGPTNELGTFEKFADEISSKWSGKERAYHARLMLQICAPL
ncbi:MAG: hypothetical protein ACYS29_15140, partial [Planctomycetota bacterium]